VRPHTLATIPNIHLPILLVTVLAATAMLAACGGDDDGDPDAGDGDSGMGDGGPGMDAGPETDSGPDDDGGTGEDGNVGRDADVETVTVTGLILGEDLGEGPPPVEGVTVSILWPDGVECDSGVTDSEGMYTVTAPRGMTMLHRVSPSTDYLGNLRGEMVRGADYEAYELRLADRTGVEEAVADTGATYDDTLGYLVAGYNPVSVMDGGEGATLDGVTHDPAFVLYPGGFLLTNVLPPICDTGETPMDDGCALDGRNDQITFPNLDGDAATVNIIDPAGGTCTERFGIAEWPVFADILITVNIDCTAS